MYVAFYQLAYAQSTCSNVRTMMQNLDLAEIQVRARTNSTMVLLANAVHVDLYIYIYNVCNNNTTPRIMRSTGLDYMYDGTCTYMYMQGRLSQATFQHTTIFCQSTPSYVPVSADDAFRPNQRRRPAVGPLGRQPPRISCGCEKDNGLISKFCEYNPKGRVVHRRLIGGHTY